MGDRRQVKWGLGLWVLPVLVLGLALYPHPAWGQELLRNAGFEGPAWQTHVVGTSISSWLAEDWQPWSVLGDQIENREVEYKLITLETSHSTDLRSHVHSGNHAQQFFTNGASHTAGFYQRVAVPPNSQVTFTIWVQIQSGNRLIYVDGRYVSDLSGGGGNYWAQVGIDPGGARPAAFGAPLPGSIVWSEPMWDITAHGVDERGNPADLWVPISVSARAQGGHVTVYTRGQCKYPTKYNSSFWDDASLAVVQPPTPTPRPPTNTPEATNTPVPTETSAPTETPAPTSTPSPTSTHTPRPTVTWTPAPSATPTLTATATYTVTPAARPTETPVPREMAAPADTATPTQVVPPTETPPSPVKLGRTEGSVGWQQTLALVIVALLVLLVAVIGWIVGRELGKRGRRSAGLTRDES